MEKLIINKIYHIFQDNINRTIANLKTLMETSKNMGIMAAKNIVTGNFNGGLDNLMFLLSEEMDSHENPLGHVETTYKRQQFLHTSVPYVEPREVVVGSKLVTVSKGNKRVVVDKPETFAYIPIIETIQQLLLNPTIGPILLKKPDQMRPGVYFDLI